VRQSVFLAGIAGDVILARATGINKFDFNVFADPFEVAVAPQLPRVGGGRTASLLRWSIVNTAGGMRLNFIGRAPEDVNVSAVGLSAGNTGGEVFVGVSEAAIVLLFVGVNWGFLVGIAAIPKDLRKLLALLVGRKLKKGARSSSVMMSGTSSLSQES
jgi:hypothetical protein